MYGSGVRIGIILTVVIARQIPQDHLRARTVWCVAATGAATRGTAVSRVVTTSFLRTAATSAVSVWLNSFPIKLEKRILDGLGKGGPSKGRPRETIKDSTKEVICKSNSSHFPYSILLKWRRN